MGFIKDILKTKLADRVEDQVKHATRRNEDSIPPAVEVTEYRPVQPTARGLIRGLLSIRLPELFGMEIHSIALHQSPTTGKRWLRYPARPLLKDGKIVRWEPHLTFDSREQERAFQDLVILELDAFCATWPRSKRWDRR